MNKNIQGTAVAAFGYTGIVTISQYSNGKIRPIINTNNAGGKPLFNFLADCLAGNFDTAPSIRPTKILFLNESDGTLTKAINAEFMELLSGPAIIQSSTESPESIVKYSFIIPQDRLVGTKFNAIGLYPRNASLEDIQDYSALCVLKNLNLNSVSSALVLDWELHISNNPTK